MTENKTDNLSIDETVGTLGFILTHEVTNDGLKRLPRCSYGRLVNKAIHFQPLDS